MNRAGYYLSQGVTLIELVVSIVIITIAVGGIMALFLGTTSTSADPMIRAQSLAIAQSYMDEIMMQPYSNDGATSGRVNYNEVDDYKAISGGGDSVCSIDNCPIQDQFGQTIDMDSNGTNDLSGYRIKVNICLCGSNCTATPCVLEMNDVSAKQITIKVSHSGLGTTMPLTSYRTNY